MEICPLVKITQVCDTKVERLILTHSVQRLSWLWKFGGLYVDTDMLMLREIPSSILDNSSFIALHNLHPDMGFSASIFQLSE